MSLTKQTILPITVTVLALFGQTLEVKAKPTQETLKQNHLTMQVAQQESSETDAIYDLLRDHQQAFNHEDLTAYLDTIHPDAPQQKKEEQNIQNLFSNYNVQAEFDHVHVMSQSQERAKVRYELTFSEDSGADYRDHQNILISELRKFNGEWHFYKTEVQNIEFLEDEITSSENEEGFNASDLIPERTPRQDCVVGICSDGPFSER